MPRAYGCDNQDYLVESTLDDPDYYEDFDPPCADTDKECIKEHAEKYCEETDKIWIEKNSTSRCDLHPQCVHGEDEAGCEAEGEYLSKGIFHPTETFNCTSSHNYTIFNIDNTSWTIFTYRAIRCDGTPTCPNGEDEKECNILAETVKYAIRKLQLLFSSSF